MTGLAMSFDTHAFYVRLKSVGFTEQQAEVIAAIQRETATAALEQPKHDFRLDDVVTNKSLDARILETELKIERVRGEIKDSEMRIITQLSIMQQDMQNTKITNRALLGLIAISVGMLIKLVFA